MGFQILYLLLFISLDGFDCERNIRLLESDLLTNYSSGIKPRKNAEIPVYVNLTFYANSIHKIDERLQQISFIGWFEITWVDEFLTWDEKEYGGMRFMNLPTEKVWRPDVSMYLKEGDPQDIGKGDFISVSSRGIMHWYPGGKYTVECMVDITKFPVDEQQCVVKIGPWQTTDWTQVLVPVQDHINIYKYSENGEWELVKTEVFANKLEKFDMTEIRHILYLRRRPLYALLGHLLPLILLSFLNSIVFCLPTSSGEKLTLSISVLLSFTVFLTIFQQMMPKKSTEIPYLSTYLSFQLFMSVMSILATIYVWRIEDKAKECKRRQSQKRRLDADKCMKYSSSLKYVQNTKLSQDCNMEFPNLTGSCMDEDLGVNDSIRRSNKKMDGSNHNEMEQNVFSVEFNDFKLSSRKNVMDDFERYKRKVKRIDKLFFIVSFCVMILSTMALSLLLIL